MNARRIDQLWLFGGLTLVIMLVLGSWFMVIKPQYTARDAVLSDTADTEVQLVAERKKLAKLNEDLKKVTTYKADLVTAQKALPYGTTTNKIPEFLKQLQILGGTYQVEVSGYSASAPQLSKAAPTVNELPISLNVEGEVENITRFLRHLQTVQPRAVLIESARLTPSETGWSLSLALKAFITSTKTTSVSS